jgi:hypothetical protein
VTRRLFHRIVQRASESPSGFSDASFMHCASGPQSSASRFIRHVAATDALSALKKETPARVPAFAPSARKGDRQSGNDGNPILDY